MKGLEEGAGCVKIGSVVAIQDYMACETERGSGMKTQERMMVQYKERICSLLRVRITAPNKRNIDGLAIFYGAIAMRKWLEKMSRSESAPSANDGSRITFTSV